MRRKAQGFTLIEIMVVIAIIAGLVTTVAVVVPKMQERQERLGCMQNLSQLGGLYKNLELESKQKAQKWSGVSCWLAMRKNTQDIKRGDEKVLICPADSGILIPENDEDKKQWDNADLANPPDNLCSYAARDFSGAPFDPESPDKEILGSDRQTADGRHMQHPQVIVVVYQNGQADTLDREALGISPDQPIVIGPESSNKMLQKLVYRKQRKE